MPSPRGLAALLPLLLAAPVRAEAPAYPPAWIRKAEADNAALSCAHLVYQRGCRALRKGRVELDVELRPDGSVARLSEASNTIAREPHVVSRCLRKNVARWRFTPPEGVAPRLRMTLVFADRC